VAELDITAFLRARLDERERAARFVLSDYAHHEAAWSVPSTGVVDIGEGSIADETILTGDGPLAEFIADNDPAFVLADVAAKRRLLAGHGPGRVVDESDGRWASDPDSWDPPWTKCTGHEWAAYPCELLRLLALPYAGHPDYRKEWKP